MVLGTVKFAGAFLSEDVVAFKDYVRDVLAGVILIPRLVA